MNFQLDKSIELLQRTPRVFKSLFYGIEYNWASVNEGIATWNAIDIIGHLIHDEKAGWIPCARIILSNTKNKRFEPLDPSVKDKITANKTIEELISEFEELRTLNLDELKSWKLTDAKLGIKGIHPKLGEVTLRELLATWTIHDMAHLNQASRVLVKHYADDVGPYSEFLSILN